MPPWAHLVLPSADSALVMMATVPCSATLRAYDRPAMPLPSTRKSKPLTAGCAGSVVLPLACGGTAAAAPALLPMAAWPVSSLLPWRADWFLGCVRSVQAAFPDSLSCQDAGSWESGRVVLRLAMVQAYR